MIVRRECVSQAASSSPSSRDVASRPPRSRCAARPATSPILARFAEQHIDDVTAGHGIPVLIPPDSGKRTGERSGPTGGRYSFMRRVLETDLGREIYRKRQTQIEPVVAHTKHNRKYTSLHRRGRAAARTSRACGPVVDRLRHGGMVSAPLSCAYRGGAGDQAEWAPGCELGRCGAPRSYSLVKR